MLFMRLLSIIVLSFLSFLIPLWEYKMHNTRKPHNEQGDVRPGRQSIKHVNFWLTLQSIPRVPHHDMTMMCLFTRCCSMAHSMVTQMSSCAAETTHAQEINALITHHSCCSYY